MQKEKITEMVQSLSDKFKIFKQQNSQVGIGGPRSKLGSYMRQQHIVMGRGGRIDDMSNE